MSERERELAGMRLMALHRHALEQGLDEGDVDAAMDSDAPKAALVRLLLASKAKDPEPEPQQSASDRFVRLLRAGGAAEREQAYAELLRLEAEHDARGATRDVGRHDGDRDGVLPQSGRGVRGRGHNGAQFRRFAT